MTPYAAAITEAMAYLAAHERTVFVGQSVKWPGTGMYSTLAGVPDDCRIEFPVAEEMQLGVSIGMALAGFIPISLFTRLNFLLLAVSQLVNHLDKLPMLGYEPKVIIRTAIGSERPLHPGPQHTGDTSTALSFMCRTIRFVRLDFAEDIVPAYRLALRSERSTVLVEHADLMND